MKIFIDIGSHVGETLVEAAKEKYAFDKIVCFEPSMFCMDDLKKFSDTEIIVENLALGSENKEIIFMFRIFHL